jgi:membrane-bound lytic murein transglycosylase D
MYVARPESRSTCIAIVMAALLAGCTAPRPGALPALPAEITAVPEPGDEAARFDFDLETDRQAGDDAPFDTSHPRVLRFVDRYRTSLRTFMSRSLRRASHHLSEVTPILAAEGVPEELAYLPIVESGFRLDAVSRAGAAGPWQFMRRTAQHYGLRIDRWVDERRDIVKATRAAARYLRDLHDLFGDWHLSLAAYNSGEAKIARIRDSRDVTDYWQMIENGYLPRETSEFVPRFIAAMEIARAPHRYGFDVPESFSEPYQYVDVDRSISLDTIALLGGTDPTALQELNPALRREAVPPGGYRVRVPQGTKRRFEIAYAQLKRRQGSAARSNPLHRVRRGETPSSIALHYGVSVRELMRRNGIRDARRLRVGQLLRIPGKHRSLDDLARQMMAANSPREPRARLN